MENPPGGGLRYALESWLESRSHRFPLDRHRVALDNIVAVLSVIYSRRSLNT